MEMSLSRIPSGHFAPAGRGHGAEEEEEAEIRLHLKIQLWSNRQQQMQVVHNITTFWSTTTHHDADGKKLIVYQQFCLHCNGSQGGGWVWGVFFDIKAHVILG